MPRRLIVAGLALASMLPLAGQERRGPQGGAPRLNFLSGYLGLSDSQKQQAQSIFDAAAESAQTAQGQLTGALEALRNASKSGQSDAELDRLASAVGNIQGQLAGIRAKAQAKVYALLTAEQKQKYDEIGNRAARRRGPGRP